MFIQRQRCHQESPILAHIIRTVDPSINKPASASHGRGRVHRCIGGIDLQYDAKQRLSGLHPENPLSFFLEKRKSSIGKIHIVVYSIRILVRTSSAEDIFPFSFPYSMSKQIYETFTGEDVTNDMLVKAAQLFSENYGSWGPNSRRPGQIKEAFPSAYLIPLIGQRVVLTARRLKEQHMPSAAVTFYASVTIDGKLVGNAFACRWEFNGKSVCWITQLVVDRDYRERGVASGLLRSLRTGREEIYGIVSSNPAACLAAARGFGSTCHPSSAGSDC